MNLKSYILAFSLLFFSSCALMKPSYSGPTGCISGDCTNGQGTYVWGPGDWHGDKYTGQYKDGRKHGQGIYMFFDGEKYDGEWKDGNYHGQGAYIFADGRRYDGEWRNGKKHGQGIYIWPDGEKYDGEFKDGIRFLGTNIWPDGNKYYGEWSDNQDGQQLRHGYGVDIKSDGTTEIGYFIDNILTTTMSLDEVEKHIGTVNIGVPYEEEIEIFSSKDFIQELDKYIAVMGLNPMGLTAQEANILSERLTTKLVSLNKYTIIERSSVDKIMKEQKFQYSGCTDTQCAVKLGKLLNSDYIIIGSVSKFGLTYSIDCRIIDVETAKILNSASYSHKGDIDNLLNKGIDTIADQLYGKDL